MRRGFTFAEVMVAISVLMIVLFGISALEASSVRGMHSMTRRQAAIILLNDVLGRARTQLAAGKTQVPLQGTTIEGPTTYTYTLAVTPPAQAQLATATAGTNQAFTALTAVTITVSWTDDEYRVKNQIAKTVFMDQPTLPDPGF